MQLIHQIFGGISKQNLNTLFEALQIQNRHYSKGSLLLEQGAENEYIRILVQGKAHAVGYTADGREVDFAVLKDGDLFGDALALSLGHHSPVSIYAESDCVVAMFPYRLLLESRHPCAYIVLKNLAGEVAEKFFAMQQRVRYITQPSLRDKIMAYLEDCHLSAGSDSFSIPFDRKNLASFLCCDRSALCRELTVLKSEGLIDYKKNLFYILKPSGGLFAKNN